MVSIFVCFLLSFGCCLIFFSGVLRFSRVCFVVVSSCLFVANCFLVFPPLFLYSVSVVSVLIPAVTCGLF